MVLLAAVVSGLVLGWVGRSADVTLGGDEATYITLSNSLEAGRYRDEFLVGTPRHAQYPPGNPAWILAIRTVTGDSGLDAVRAINLLAIAVASLLVADSLRRLGLATVGAAAGAATAVNPILADLAGTALSEPPYILFVSVALWATVATAPGRARPRLGVAAAFALMAFFTRSIGLSTIAAILVALFRRARLVTVMATIVAMTVVAACWFWYTTSAGAMSIGNSYSTDLTNTAPDVGGAIRHAAWIAKEYVFRVPVYQLGLPDIPGTNLDTQLVAGGLFVLLLAGLVALVRRWPEAATMLLGSTAILLVWPWPVLRLMNPMIPWILAAIYLGTADIAARLGARAPLRIVVAVAIIIGGGGAMGSVRRAIRTTHCRATGPYTAEACFRPMERDFARIADFVLDSLPPNAVVYTTKPSVVHLLTGRQALPLQTLDADEFERFLAGEGGSHVVISGFPEGDPQAARGVLATHCHDVAALKILPRALVLAPRNAASAEPDACAALRRLVSTFEPN